MSVYKVDICGVTTSKLPVLKDDEKEELFEKIKKGDKAAREKAHKNQARRKTERKKPYEGAL